MENIANKSPFLIVALGDFNVRIQGWYQNDLGTFEGCKIDMATSQFSFSQTIKEPRHVFSHLVYSIDLILKSHPNLVTHSGVHPRLHPNCHHQIVFAKFNLTIIYAQSNKRLVWHYQQANTDLVKEAIELFDWEKSLSNLDVNKQISVLNETIMNIFEMLNPKCY